MLAVLKKSMCWLVLFSLVLSLAIGYAALTDNLFLYGEANISAKPFVGVYIFAVEEYSRSSSLSSVSASFVKPTNLSQTVRASGNGASITYKVTLHNNSNVTYWYIKQDFVKDLEANNLIGQSGGITVTTKDHPQDTVATFNNEDWIPPQTYRDVYVTFTYGQQAQGYRATFINFLFGLKMDSVHDKFVTVLNDNAPGGGYDYLSEVFDKKFAENGGKVIANVGEEKEIFDTLFGENLTINIDGKEVPVTVMIQRENVDGRQTGDDYSGSSGAPTGCEYTVYVTVDALDSPTGKAMVYAVSYSNGGIGVSDGSWYQLGQLYEGTADIIDYDTSTPGIQGAFDIYSWSATANSYEAADGIIYLVGQEQGDQYDKLKSLEDIMSTNDQDIFNDIDNKRIFKTVFDIVNNTSNTSKPGYTGLREAFYAAAPFYNILNGGQEIKVNRSCTRAEIIPYLEAIQKALDYYNELN